ncbi:Uncharacterized protein DBV15_07103 [Temnothorax longispinosus]|uniref:Uncharacterized protein n=1 Tax=Temnothorax longispinosus TaxID=300112 RepID=A0A4S2KRP5_9HYME|nr:Uncharacterized protein DBV15_07103 [Temnothorax longispinosus]
MDPQETKDERRAIYFGPLFPRRNAVARRRACEREPEAEDRCAEAVGNRARAGVAGGLDDELPTSRDGCREPHAIKAKRYETLRGSSSTGGDVHCLSPESRGSIVPSAADNELVSFNAMVRYLQPAPVSIADTS